MDKLKLNKEFNNRNPENPKRIPFFKQCERAAYRALDLPEIKDACVIKVNPSMAQMKLRELLLKEKKTLLVPCTSLTDEKFLFQINGEVLSMAKAYKASTKKGAANIGVAKSIDDFHRGFHIDAVVVGSVAVATNGVRLGKGKGFAELEWAILWKKGIVDENTCVITTVHEKQIVSQEELPDSLMSDHDLPVDIIVTPWKTYRVSPKLKKPKAGIIWDEICDERIQEMPVLKKLKELY